MVSSLIYGKMSCLIENEILEIEGNVRLLSINEIADISHFLFLLKIRKKVWR